ncbi:MAG: FAD-dependent monooxygenase [Acidobacteria bacterium]|nr:FAD-dependent monooxygenase [Acidobacteriota bacterium]
MRIVIIGGGIGGLSSALALRRAGFEPEVFEQAPALLDVGAAIAVWPNAMRVLARLGVGEAVSEKSGQIKQARWMAWDGRVLNSFALPDEDAPAVALHRADLQGVLRASLPPESIHLGKHFDSFTSTPASVSASFADGTVVEGDALIAADGLHSRVRAQLLGDGEPVYRGYTVWRGIASIKHPALPPLTATEVYGDGQRFGIGPVGMNRTGWWATANEPENVPESASEHQEKLLRLFAGWHAPVNELIRATPSANILRNAAYDRPPAARWDVEAVTLLGDAAHPMTPNLGQGGCMAIEDAAILARCFEKYGHVSRALRSYEAHRRARTATVSRYSLRYGAVGQWQTSRALRLRSALLSTIPASVGRRLLRLVFDYDAYSINL